PAEVSRRHALRLVAVAHQADALHLRDLGLWIAVGEVLAKQRIGIDLFFLPAAGRRSAAEDDAVRDHERVADAVAGAADLAVGAPQQLDRVPFQAALPRHVHVRRRIATAWLALVAAPG